MKNNKNTTQQQETYFQQYPGLGTIDALPEILDKVVLAPTVKSQKRIEYYNIPCAFDIETTSFYEGENKRATMYEWTLGLAGYVIYGRTWPQFIQACDMISERLALTSNKRIIIYIHNFSFEFGFLAKWFNWEKVFAIDERKPCYALTDIGIEFRCSYILSGYSLETVGKNLKTYKVEKLVGDLDYDKLRNCETPLTAQELAYCENDVRVVMSYIQECIERDGDITQVQLTKTSYVRKFARNMVMRVPGNKQLTKYKSLNYRNLMQDLTLSLDEFIQSTRCFHGGFTHSSCFWSTQVVDDVGSIDFTSAYPSCMFEQFPMSHGEVVVIHNIKELERNLILYCCMFDIQFIGLEAKVMYEHPLSASHCWDVSGSTEDNGRIVCATSLKTTITEQEYFIYKRFYKWKEIRIGTFRRYRKGYLPKDLLLAVLKLYSDKTTLKGVEGMEVEYQSAKEQLNACYGMMVTSPIRDEIVFEEGWSSVEPDINEALEKYNKSKNRFLFYLWGVWITAYNMAHLMTGILEFGPDYVYSDTDSIKGRNIVGHMDYINSYNELITHKINMCLDHYGIDRALACPKTIKGVPKPLGVWDIEKPYDRFKSLGAKRYAVQQGDKFNITVSGVNKKVAVPYMLKTYGPEHFFEAFSDDLILPAGAAGKLTHTYIDEDMQGALTDYTGHTALYYEHSGVHLEQTSYEMSLTAMYLKFLQDIKIEMRL